MTSFFFLLFSSLKKTQGINLTSKMTQQSHPLRSSQSLQMVYQKRQRSPSSLQQQISKSKQEHQVLLVEKDKSTKCSSHADIFPIASSQKEKFAIGKNDNNDQEKGHEAPNINTHFSLSSQIKDSNGSYSHTDKPVKTNISVTSNPIGTNHTQSENHRKSIKGNDSRHEHSVKSDSLSNLPSQPYYQSKLRMSPQSSDLKSESSFVSFEKRKENQKSPNVKQRFVPIFRPKSKIQKSTLPLLSSNTKVKSSHMDSSRIIPIFKAKQHFSISQPSSNSKDRLLKCPFKPDYNQKIKSNVTKTNSSLSSMKSMNNVRLAMSPIPENELTSESRISNCDTSNICSTSPLLKNRTPKIIPIFKSKTPKTQLSKPFKVNISSPTKSKIKISSPFQTNFMPKPIADSKFLQGNSSLSSATGNPKAKVKKRSKLTDKVSETSFFFNYHYICNI